MSTPEKDLRNYESGLVDCDALYGEYVTKFNEQYHYHIHHDPGALIDMITDNFDKREAISIAASLKCGDYCEAGKNVEYMYRCAVRDEVLREMDLDYSAHLLEDYELVWVKS